MKINKFGILTIALSALFLSCNDSDKDEIIPSDSDYSDGILVSGEGSTTTGSITFIPSDLSAPQQQIYKTENDTELGTFVQSIEFSETKAYISVDNQQTITVVDRYSFKEIAKINTQLEHPRYMEVVGDIGYSTNWGSTSDETDDFIAVIDLNANTVTKTIPVPLGPERIVEKNGSLYVSHKGAWGTNNVISVIDIATEVVTEIEVGYKPDELLFDSSDMLWVLSSGNESWTGSESKGSITQINTNTNTILKTIDFEDTEHPELMEILQDKIYYFLGDAIYEMEVTATDLPSTKFIETGYIYGMSLNNSQLFTVIASYTALSDLHVYSLSSKSMTKTLKVGLGASKIYFND